MSPFSRRSIKRKIWGDISNRSQSMDLKKDWWLIGVMIFGH